MVNLFARRVVRPLLAWVRAGWPTALQIFAVLVAVLAIAFLPAHAAAAGALAAVAITCYSAFRAGNVGRVFGVTALALSITVWPTFVDAYEIPTAPAGSWTATAITTGTIPFNPAPIAAETGTYTKTTPSGLKLNITVDGVFPNGASGSYFNPPQTNTTGLNPSAAGTNPGVFTTTPVLPTSTNPISLITSFDPCKTTFTASLTCTGLGTVKVTLTDPVGGAVPVVAPKIHISRVGGTATLGTVMELGTGLQINAAGSSPGISFSSAASATPTLNVGATEFYGDPNAAGTTLNVNCGVAAGTTAACGTVQVNGNMATMLLNVKAYRTNLGPNSWDTNADGYFFDMSFDEDFGGAPNSYEGGGTAAGHVITDLRLGSAVSADNATTANGTATGTSLVTTDPNAVVAPAAAGDTNDGVTSFPSLLTSNIGSSYTVTPTFSGASRAGKICGWLDFDRSGTFTAAEGVCNTFASGATSAPLAWTVPTATTAGPTYARVRVTYDTNMSTASFNGLFSSGEVEDYLVQIKPAVKVVKALLPATDTGTFNLSVNGTNFATAIGNAGTTGFKSVYHTDTPDVTVATNVSAAAITGVVLTETGAGASVLTDYFTTSACTNAAGTAVTVAGTALAPSITIPLSVTGASANGQAQTITCTLTNTRKANVTLTKISNGAVGGFTFTGTNGWTSQTITTTASGVGVVGAKQNLTTNGTATTITEGIPAGYVLASATCSGLGTGGTATPNLATGAVALDAAATAAGSNIACTFTNTKLPTIVVTKNSVGGVGPFNFTGTNGYPGQTVTTVTSGVNASGPAVTLTAANTLTRITEAVPAGYVLSTIACTGTGAGNTTNNLASGFVDIAVGGTAPGATINCTFTNSKKPTVTLTKISNGGVGPYTFTGTNGWTSQTITTTVAGTGVAGATQTLTAPSTATTITEGIPAGYALTNASCTGLGTGGTAVPNFATGALTLDVAATAPGSDISCTFTNAKLPTVTLTKISNGGVGPYTFTGTNGWTSQTITTTTAGTGVAGAAQTLTVASTATTLTEAIPAGYALTNASCTGLGTGGTAVPNLATGALALDAAATAPGSNIACTFTNAKLPTVTLTKISNGGVGPYTFTGTNGWTSQTITTTTAGTGVAGAAQTLTAASTATTLTEAIPAGYALTNASCTGLGTGGTAVPNLATGALALDAAATAPGSNIACTFTNAKLPTVTLTKISNGGVGPFTFTGDNGWTSQTITTTASGTGVAGALQTLSSPAAVTTITEAVPVGYALASATCTGLGSGGTATPNLATGALVLNAAATAAGSNITCTFTNTKLPTVTLTKISNGGVGPFTFTGNNGWTSQTITTATAGTGVAGATQILATPATVTTITEGIPSGYVLASASCSGLGSGGTATPNLATGAVAFDTAATAAGAAINCTFTNNKLPTLTLVKTVTNDNGGTVALSSVALTATGPSTITGVTAAGSVTNAQVPLGTYALTEANPTGYAAGAWSCTAGTLTGSSLVLAAGQNATCTINDNDISPILTLVKTVTNDNGGTLAANTVALTATGPTAITGVTASPAVTNAAVNAGTYTLTEASTPGYAQGAWSCSAGTLTGNSLVLVPGQNATCTINNNDISPTLTLVKTVTNDNGGTLAINTVTLTAAGPTSISGVTAAAAVTNANVNAGTYALSETATPGYTQGAWSCSAGTLTGSSLVLAPGQNATCTINNNDNGPVLTLVKTITNDNGGTVAANTVSLSATGPVSIAGVTGSGAVTSATVSAGTYTLSEANPVGYAAGAWSCTAGTLTGSSLALALGQTATCTINDNDISPVLSLVKTVTNDNGGTVLASSVNLTATGPTTITGASGTAAVTNASINPGTYTLTEVNPVGYTAGSWSCTAGTLTGNNLALALGQTASCTINDNDISPTLTLVKTVTNDDGGPLAANTVNLTATGPTTITGVTGNAAVTSASVNAGSYALSEASVPGYTSGAWSCTVGTLAGSNLTLAPGQNATCTIDNNDIAPKLTLAKTVTNDDGGTSATTAFTLTAAGPVTITGATGAAAITSANVKVGTYALSEAGPAGYAAGAWSCSAGTLAGSNLTLAAGQVATCTINNNDVAPILTLVKTVTNDNGGTVAANTVSLSAVGPVSVAGVSGAPAVTSATVKAGVYALSEANPAGYTAGSWSCTAGTLAGSNLTLANGQTSICTINDNDISPVLTLAKTVTNDNGGTAVLSSFTLAATGPTSVSGASGAPAVTSAAVDAGVYALSETGPAGYTASVWSCSAGTLAGSNLTLAPGQTAVCSINNNDDPAKLTLVKTVVNDNGGTSVVADFTLKATGPTTISGVSTAASVTNATVNAGTYALSETGPAGYTASTWSCSAGTLTGSSLALASGQNATCTLNNNDISPKLTLVKTVTNDNGGTSVVADFTLTATGPTSVTGITGAATVTNANVNVGTYTLTESGPTGYTAGAWSCTAGALTGNSLVLALNQSATCTINNNDISPKLTLVKTVTNDSGGSNVVADFTLKATGPTTITGLTGSASVTNANVNVGTYALSETGPSGYTAGAWSCDAGTLSGSNLTLALNQSATCTLNNDDTPATITLSKISNGGTGAFVFNGTNGFGTAQTITTTVSGASVAGATRTLAASSTATTITETIPTGYGLTAASCAGIGSGTATPNLLTGALALDAAATAPGNTINCTFTNGVASFTVAKAADISNIITPGPITYTITVANTGQADLTSPTLADNLTQAGSPKALSTGPTLTSGDAASPGVLNVGETWIYKATYNVTQADIDSGGTFSNTATFDTQQTNPSVSAPAVTTISQLPDLSVTKSSPTTSFAAVNDPISYSYLVRNTGNVTVTNAITIADNKTTVACPALTGGILAPNDTITCTASYLATQSDIDAGGVTNTASANTLFGGNPIASLPVNKFVPAVQSPGLSVVKSSPSYTFINPGDIVNYEYFVRNTGNTTLNAPFTVNDNLVTVTCPATPTTLVPGAQGSPGNDITCTASHVVTQDDLNLGSVTNLASATSGTTTSPQTSKSIPPAATPALSITKDTVPPGVTFNTLNQVVTYTYTVQNTGGATLTRAIDVYDDKIAGAISCWTPTVGDPNFTPGTPPPNGETATCTANYTVTQADLDRGYVTNQAYAQTTFGGLNPVGNIVVTSPPAPKTTNAVQAPQLKVTKSVSPDPVVGLALGQSLTYAIDVQNIGNITVSNINVTDPLIPALGCNIVSLAPTAHNAVNSCTGTYIVTQADVDAGNIHNTASASGVTPQGAPVLPIATGSKDTAIPQVKTMSVAKSLSSNADQDSSSSITLGDALTYSVTATNTGTVTQTNVIVSDNKITPASKTCLTLAPNATCILTGTYIVTQADVDAGTIGNTGTLTSDIITTPQTSVVNTPVAQLSQLTTLKTKTGFTDNDANTILTVGDTLHYTVTATNSGTVTQNAVTVSDPLLTPNSNTCDPLSIGAVCTLTGDHIVTAAEATAGVVNNTGSATSTLITTPVTSLVSTPVTRIITAVTDAPASVIGATGAPSLINAYANDTLNGLAATPSNITGTVLSPATPIAGGPVPTLDVATGIVTVPPGTPAGPYTINYQICEIANPTNCSVANINVTVTAAPVVATADTATGINGASGATAVTNAFNGDTINGNPATPSNSILTANTAVPPQLAFDPATGIVDVLPGTPAGTYTFDYKICEKLNPTNCKIATISVTVVAAPLVATNDTPAPVNGATGNPSLIDAYANDTLNGVPVSLGTINGTIVAPAVSIGGKPVPVLDPATGLVSVPAGTPAGPYTITYQICEQLNPISNCKTAIVTVNVTAAPLVAANDTPAPVNGATGNANLTNAFTNDTLNGVPTSLTTTTASIVTAATPIGGGPVPALNPTTGNVAVPAGTPAGSYTITYEVCENLNPTNCKQATVTVVVLAAPIVATNDTPANVNGATGNPSLVNAFANDTLNNVAASPTTINASVVTSATPIGGGPVPTLDTATGNVAVPAGTPAGTYVITYKICEQLNPTNCSTADVTVVVDPAPILAVPDTPAPVNGATGNPNIVNAYTNDTLNGVAVTLGNTTGTVLSPATPLSVGASVPVLDPATGIVSVPAGTPAGTYSISYQICENLNPTNCATSTVTVDVTAAPILAVADAPAAVNGKIGTANLVDAYANDKLNSIPVTLATITGTILAPATPATVGANVPLLDPATGTVSVPAATPAGTYTIDYRICEKLNPTNCSNATITVVVDASVIAALPDTPAPINGVDGGTTVTVLANDTLNGLAVVPSEINLTPGTAPTPAAGAITMNADGTITVAPGTTAGSYPYSYKICEKLNPLNCSTATATVVVAAAPILANADTPLNVNGASGNPSLIDAYANDTLNGVPVTLATITGSVTIPATPIGGGPVPVLDPATGVVSVPAGTPAGPYTITYKICESLNPANCSTTTVTVNVDAAPVVATNDTASGVNGANGATAVVNAFTGDTINGNPASPANSTLTANTAVPPQLAFDPATGIVDVLPGTPAGTYTFDYKICEILNPTNCKIASVSIDVIAAPILATNDTPASVNGATGNPSLVNAYTNDQLNSAAATPANITGTILAAATPASAGAPVPVLDPATGNVSVPAGTPAGSYSISYKICEQLNPLNCSTATISVVVTEAPIVATNDFTPAVNGLVGNPSLDNAYANDLLNNVAVVPANIIGSVLTPATPVTVGAPVPALDPATGDISVPAGTPAGSYVIHYQICEKLNPTNCAVADITVPVVAAQIIALNDTPAPVNGANGNPTLTNAFTNDTLNGVTFAPANILGSVLIPATPATVGAPVPALDPVTGNVAVPANTPAGTYTIHYQICEKLNPSNCAVADVIVVVDPSPIVATNDTATGINGASGAANVTNAFTADTINGLAATPSNAVLSVATGSTVPPQLTFDTATGNVSVLSGTPVGTYTFDYQICEILNPTNCKTATETVTVVAAVIATNPDTPASVNGATGNPSLVNAYTNDLLNSVPVTLSTITGTVLAPATPVTVGAPVPALDPVTGNVAVPPNTPAGTYTITYQICENLNPANCSDSSVTVIVDPSPIIATSDSVTGINGATGTPLALNVFTGDTVNGATATATNAILSLATGSTVPTGLTFNTSTGDVAVSPDTPAGSYTFDYQICETTNPANCKTASVTVGVVAAPLVATNDNPPNVNGATGNPTLVNAFTNDSFNSAPVDLAKVTATVTTPAVPATVGAPVPALDPSTGNVSVPPGTPAGTYTITYQLCENLNPIANCKTAVVTVLVDAAPVVATADTATGINGASGATAVTNALNGDLINSAPATTANSILSVATGSTVPPQLVFDPTTGNVDVKPGTPAGTYTFDYQICEALNPTNCKTATISVTTIASPLVATPDTATGINGASGSTAVTNALNGDLINGVAATPANAILSVATGSTVPPQLAFNPATGVVDVLPGTPAGTYTFDYQICEALNPTNCTTATISVTTIGSPVVATADTVTGINGATGATSVTNALNGDLINNVAATPTNSVLSVATGSTVPPQLTFNPATGAVDVLPGTPAGTYTFDYQICEALNPTNCKIATISVTTVPSPLLAVNDTATGINGATGATAVTNALNGDLINGFAATTANSILSVATGSTVPPQLVFNPATGAVDVVAGTPAGTYTFDYQICETLNPTNCTTATISVTTIASPIVATADTVTGINGATGATAVTDALNGDLINGVAATTANSILSVATGSTVPPQLTFNPATGAVDVVAGTPAGTYTFDYQICETLNPTNCKTATISVTTVASPVVATPDTVSGINGASGAIAVTNALNGDLINSAPATTTNSILSVATGSTVPPQLAFDPTTGAVDVLPGTPAGTYTFDYQICEALNPANCKTATISVSTVASPVVATADTIIGINGATGAPAVLNALTGDTINAAPATVTNAILSVATGSTVPPQLAFNPATGAVDVLPGTPAGTYTFDYQICETINPTNCKTATVSVTTIASSVVATADTVGGINGTTGATGVINALNGDLINGVAATTANSILTVATGSTVPPQLVFDPATGAVDVKPGTPAGTYTFDYQICESLNPTNCKTATISVTTVPSAIIATPDTAVGVNGATGALAATNAFNGDLINGAPATPANAVLTVATGSTVPPQLTLNPATGSVDVNPGSPAGIYTFDYQICETINPTNCKTATVTITVVPPVIAAAPDSPATVFDTKTAIIGAVNVLTNDTLNGVQATPATVIITPVGTLPAGVTLNPDGTVDLAQYLATGTYTFDYQICDILNPTNCKTATTTIKVKKTVPAVSGTVFFDTNGNGVQDGGESVLPGYTVELVLGSVVVDTTLTATDGTYSIFGFPPAAGYKLIFKNPSGVAVGAITGLDFTNSTVLTNQNQPIDPSGVIYDSVTGAPVSGAVVTLTTTSGVPLPQACLLPNQQAQTTTANGQYRFDVLPGSAPECPVGQTEYRIVVGSPANYLPAPSTSIIPQGAPLDANACAVAPAACLVSPSAVPPPVATPAPYYLALLLQAGSPNVINNHIPLDPILAGTATFTKTALKSEVHRGERVPYVIQATAMNFTKANVVDIVPPGFDYVPGSALVNGVAATPTISGNQLTFTNITATGGALKVELTLIANAAVQPGPATNKAQLINFFTNTLVSNARATVTVVADPVFDCGEIIGRVFEDANRNGYQDEGEKGLPGVRIATVKGLLVTTDKFGRFHVACADMPDHDIGSNFVMKLDTRTLPSGYRLTTENPRDVRLTAGKMTKLNFGASIAHLVDLDLNGQVFKSGSSELLPEWRAGLATLIAKLDEEPSTLRLTYHTGSEPTALASKRLSAVSTLITNLWSKVDGRYKLPIETRSVDAKGGAQ